MSEVTDLTQRLNAKRTALGQHGILTCACQMQAEQPVGFLPTVLSVPGGNGIAGGEVITGLACAACGWGHAVVGGRIVEEQA